MASLRTLLIAFFAFLVCYFFYVSPNCPAWLCFRMTENTRPSARSVALGISLTASYGLVSVRYHDGSYDDIGRIDGSSEYLDMMRRFALPSSSHPAPPYQDMEDLWNDQPRQWLRSARKLLHLPASSDVGTMSKLTSSLLSLATPHIHPSSVDSVVISYPALPGLYAEDISDVGHYLALPVRAGNHHYPPRSLVSAYAGYGMGLCSSYTSEKQCRDEGLALPVRSTIFVERTSVAILLHGTTMREAYDLGDPDADISTHFFSSSETADEQMRKEIIREKVMELLRRFLMPSPPPESITVLLVGDADMKAVREVVYSAVEDEGFKVDMLEPSDPGFVTARGAAELAWRALSLTE